MDPVAATVTGVVVAVAFVGVVGTGLVHWAQQEKAHQTFDLFRVANYFKSQLYLGKCKREMKDLKDWPLLCHYQKAVTHDCYMDEMVVDWMGLLPVLLDNTALRAATSRSGPDLMALLSRLLSPALSQLITKASRTTACQTVDDKKCSRENPLYTVIWTLKGAAFKGRATSEGLIRFNGEAVKAKAALEVWVFQRPERGRNVEAEEMLRLTDRMARLTS